jgi:hypothetical protein
MRICVVERRRANAISIDPRLTLAFDRVVDLHAGGVEEEIVGDEERRRAEDEQPDGQQTRLVDGAWRIPRN